MVDAIAQKEMPRYQCFKVVHALKIRHVLRHEDGSAVITPEDHEYSDFAVDAAFMAKHDPKAGGYYLIYKDGYKSFSPAEAFEDGYTLIPNGKGE